MLKENQETKRNNSAYSYYFLLSLGQGEELRASPSALQCVSLLVVSTQHQYPDAREAHGIKIHFHTSSN